MKTDELSLAGLAVLITRPQGQAERVAQVIAAAGGEPIVFPTIEIRAIENRAPLEALFDRLEDYHLAIFVSANAVESSLPLLLRRRKIPPELRCAAVGNATRAALEAFSVKEVLAPTEHYDSEALLALPEMQAIQGKRVLIFRGESGREVIAETLRNRGAQVDYAVCYRRVRPQRDTAALAARWRAGGVHGVSAMSLESLQNLFHMLDSPTRKLLVATPVFVPHPRIAEEARKLGLADVRVTSHGDNALIESLSTCRKP